MILPIKSAQPCCNNLLKVKVTRMWSLSKGIQYENSCPVHLLLCVFRYRAGITDIGEVVQPKPHANVRLTHWSMISTMLNWQWHYFNIATRGNMERFRMVKNVPIKWSNSVTAGMSRVLQVCEHSENLGASVRRSVHWYRRSYWGRPLLESECSEISKG
jgi:hypothetical protein